MDGNILILLLAAGLLHASWHAMVKASPDRLIGLAGMNLVSVCVALALLPLANPLPPKAWLILAISVPLHAGYKVALAKVYEHSDLSQGYPFARGVAPILSVLGAFLLLGEVPPLSHLIAILAICAGLILLAAEKSPGPSRHWKSLLVAAVAGLMVASYSVVDAWGTRSTLNWLDFTLWLYVLDGGTFVVVAHLMRGKALWQNLAQRKSETLTSGLLGSISFGVFLWALSAGPVGPVSAIRETSVLFASLIGIFILKEPLSLLRILAAILIFAGIFMMATAH